jgi:hypothetical protein
MPETTTADRVDRIADLLQQVNDELLVEIARIRAKLPPTRPELRLVTKEDDGA